MPLRNDVVVVEDSVKEFYGITNDDPHPYHLFHGKMSSCSQRVRLTLAELGVEYTSHVIDLLKQEHATAQYQTIHPHGIVPALMNKDGKIYIESMDIMSYLVQKYKEKQDLVLGKEDGDPLQALPLLQLIAQSQEDLKYLSFEFLFKIAGTPSEEEIEQFQTNHQNTALKEFHKEAYLGFDKDRINLAIQRTDEGLQRLESILSSHSQAKVVENGEEESQPSPVYLEGDGTTLSLSDLAWFPNIHRIYSFLDWPQFVDKYPLLLNWYTHMSQRPSFQQAIFPFQDMFATMAMKGYVKTRQIQHTDIASFPYFQEGMNEFQDAVNHDNGGEEEEFQDAIPAM